MGNFQINCGRNLTKQSAGSASRSPASRETDNLESSEHNAQPQARGPFLRRGGGLTSFQQRRAWACSRARGEQSLEVAFYPNCDLHRCFLKELHLSRQAGSPGNASLRKSLQALLRASSWIPCSETGSLPLHTTPTGNEPGLHTAQNSVSSDLSCEPCCFPKGHNLTSREQVPILLTFPRNKIGTPSLPGSQNAQGSASM